MLNNTNPGVGNITNVVANQKDNFKSLALENASVIPSQAALDDTAATSIENYYRMVKAIRTTGVWLIGWTIYSAFQQNITWAIILVLVSLMTFYFADVAALFIVLAGVMLWAAVFNIFLSGDPVWIGAGVVQVLFTIMTIRDYRKYRSAKADYSSTLVQQDISTLPHRESRLAWSALLLGSAILVGIVGFVPASIVLEDELFTTIFITIMEIGVLGLVVGIAALVSGSGYKAAAVIGIGLGVLSILIEILIAIMGSTQ